MLFTWRAALSIYGEGKLKHEKTFTNLFIYKFLYHTLNAKCAPTASSVTLTFVNGGGKWEESSALKYSKPCAGFRKNINE